MIRNYANVIEELRQQAAGVCDELLQSLADNSLSHERARELLAKYQETLSASDLLANTSTDKFDVAGTDAADQEYETCDEDQQHSDNTEEALWTEAEHQLNTTIVSKNHLRLVTKETTHDFELCLAVLDAKGQVSEFELNSSEKKRLVIGRSRSRPIAGVDLTIEDTGISSKHCEISWSEAGGWTLIDFGTTNGTELNGEPVIGESSMTRVGEICIGNSVIKFFPKAQQHKFLESMRLIVEK